MQPTGKPFLFLSDADSETTKSRLRVSGIPYLKKRLESGPDNWMSIASLLQDEPIAGVLVKLSVKTMMQKLMLLEYEEAQEEVFRRVAALPHVVFVHSTFFGLSLAGSSGADDDEDADSWFGPEGYFFTLDGDERDWMLDFFEEYGLNVVPYRRNAELSVLAAEFIESRQQNLLFRFYVPEGRLYAAQTTDTLALFRDYLVRSLRMQIRQTTRTTPSGTVYEFFGDGELAADEVASHLPGFSRVMDLSLSDPSAAEAMLVASGADPVEVARLVTDYAKRARRILRDLRQEREQKLLTIRHRFEDELDDIAPNMAPSALKQIVDQLIPEPAEPGAALMTPNVSLSHQSIGSLVVNYNPQFYDKVEGIVAQTIHGNQTIGIEASQLLDFIRQQGSKTELTSAVYELEDPDTPPERKLSAGRRLQAFLGMVGEKVTEKVVEAGIASLQAYIQTKLGPLG